MDSRWISACLLLCSLLLNGVGFAQEVKRFPHYCDTLSWQHHNEPDLAGFRLYCGTSPDQSLWALIGTVPRVDTSASCQEFEFTHLGEWHCGLTAYDTSNNESEMGLWPTLIHHYLPLTVREALPVAPRIAEANGRIILPASDVHIVTTSTAGQAWQAGPVSSLDALRALPNSGTVNDFNFLTDSPRASFRVAVTGGRYALWVRGYAENSGDDSVHVGADGIDPNTASKIEGFVPFAEWQWSRVRREGLGDAYLDLDAGPHTIDVWMREDGFAFSIILLTKDLSFVPTGGQP